MTGKRKGWQQPKQPTTTTTTTMSTNSTASAGRPATTTNPHHSPYQDEDEDAEEECRAAAKGLSFLAATAILGDSAISLAVSFLFLLVAVIVAVHVHHGPTIKASRTKRTADTATTTTICPTAGRAAAVFFSPYESLGPLPPQLQLSLSSPPKIYDTSDLILQGSSSSSSQDGNNYKHSSSVFYLPTPQIRSEYERDGVVCVRGLIPAALLAELDLETSAFVDEQRAKDRARRDHPRKGGSAGGSTQFYASAHSAIFQRSALHGSSTTVSNITSSLSSTREPSALMHLALWSPVPAFAAALLNLSKADHKIEVSSTPTPSSSNNNETFRLIGDILLAKDDDQYVCGWHVDDLGFWPATPDSSVGINAWVALDDMEHTATTGGFALAVQSHTAPWREAAYHATGASTNFPKGGYNDARHMFETRTGQGTCNLQRAAPHLHRRMEETARIYPVKRGDVIFHTRWLFHRTVAVDQKYTTGGSTNDDTANGNEFSQPSKVYRRYSIRYGPGSSTIIPPGFGTELSVLWDEENGGRTADEVCRRDGPWYPQAWPLMRDDEVEKFWNEIESLANGKLPVAQARQARRRQEKKPFLKRIAKEQHRLSTYGQ
jgi:Phytanoyl-CoA dioxygenase (PhyH)